ncbi:MAG: YeeE/YedE thiosulfate transporter family protein [Parvibaculaceae bacterium]
MDILMIVLLGLAMGAVFGLALEKSRVFEPGMIVGQMRLQNFIMLRVFLSAIATGLVSIAVLHGLGLIELHPKAFVLGGQIVGGGLLGVGMVIAGACPGTVFAQIGAGYRDAWATLIGAIAGAMAYGYALPSFSILLEDAGKATFADISGQPFWLLALFVAAGLVVVLFVMEKWRPAQSELGADFDGCGIDAGTHPSKMPASSE